LAATLVLSGMALAACPGPAIVEGPDAAVNRTDGSAPTAPDASPTGLDASRLLDASEGLDASAGPDASATGLDASASPDASGAPDASTSRDASIVLLPDGGQPVGSVQFSPSSAEQGASKVPVNAVTSLTLDPASFSVVIDFSSGAAIFNAVVTGDHYFTFELEVASDAPVGLWAVTAESNGQQATGLFEIVEKQVVTKTLEFVPSVLTRGQTTPVELRAQNIQLYSTLQVSFPPESGIQVSGLTVAGSGALATMSLQVDGAAPLGQATAEVTNGAQGYTPKVTVTDGTAGALRFDEVMPHPSSLTAGYVELMNVGAAAVSTAGWKLALDGGATVALPAKTLAAGERLLLASGAGVPGGAVVVTGLGFPLDSGRLVLKDASDVQMDAARWNLSDAACAAAVGIAMERVDPKVSGEVASNWLPSQALVRAAMTPQDWASDRGSPGLPSFVSVSAQSLVVGTPVTHDLARTSLLHHPLTIARGSWVALAANVDRVAGYATAALFAVDPATGAAFTPDYVTTDFGDPVAVLEIPTGSGANASLDVRIWADPIDLFQPSMYSALAAAPSALKATPANLDLLPNETGTFAVNVIFDAVKVGGSTSLTLAVDPAKLQFQSDDPTVATVSAAGVVTALKTGSTNVNATLAQPDGPRTIQVPVRVGDTSGNGETCDVAIDVTAGAHLLGSTLGANDDYTPNGQKLHCPLATYSAEDRAYVVRPTTATTYKVTVTPEGTYNPILYAVTDCAAMATNDCVAGTAFNGAGQPDTITFTVAANASVFVIVDANIAASGASHGNYTLDVVIQ
jgi:hypothetical protein